jgi:hypothetical protein
MQVRRWIIGKGCGQRMRGMRNRVYVIRHADARAWCSQGVALL